MTHQIFNLPPQQPLSSAGRVLPGSKISFFLTGTATPTPVYTTSALSVAHTQPLVADSGGRFATAYLDPTITYKATVTDSAGTLLYTVDPVNDVLLSQATIGQYLYPLTSAETAALVTPATYAYPPGDVRRYGTITGSGGADTAIVQAAINQSMQTGGSPWYVPKGITVSVATGGATTSPVGSALTITSSCVGIIDGSITTTNNCNTIRCTADDVSITGIGSISGYGTYFQSGADNGACFKNSGSRVRFAVNINNPPQYGVFYTSSSASGGQIGPLVVRGGPTSKTATQHYGVEIEGPFRGLRIDGIQILPNGSGVCVQGVASGTNGGLPSGVTVSNVYARQVWDHTTYWYGSNCTLTNISAYQTGGSGVKAIGCNALSSISADDCTGGGIDLCNFAGGSLAGFSVTDFQGIGISVEQLDSAADNSLTAFSISTGVVRGKASDTDVRCGIRVLTTFSGTATSQSDFTISNVVIKDACQSSTSEGAIQLQVGSGKVVARAKIKNCTINTCGYVGIELSGGGTFRDCEIDDNIVYNPGSHSSAAGSDTHGFRIQAAGTVMEFGSMSSNFARDDRGGSAKMAIGFSVGGTATLVRFKDNDAIGWTTSMGTLIGSGDYTAGDTTPSVRNRVNGGGGLHITNSGATTITNFDDGNEGDVIVCTFADSNTTVNRSNAALAGGANFTSTANDSLTLVKRGSLWIEQARAVAS